MKTGVKSIGWIALALWTGPVAAQVTSSETNRLRQYGWVEFGTSIMPDFDATLSSGSLTSDLTLSSDPGFAVHGGLGQWLRPWLAFEAQGGFLYNNLNSTDSSSTISPSLLQVPLFMNVVLQPSSEWRIKPFVGAGAGAMISWLNADGTVDTGGAGSVQIDGSSTEAVFAYQGFAGLRFRVTREGEFGLTYRFMSGGSPAWSLNAQDTGDSVARLKADDIFVHSIALTFCLRF